MTYHVFDESIMAKEALFLSYRRKPTQYLALLLFKELTQRGYDVFWDYESIGVGRFEDVIFDQIAARPFFLVLLAPGTLDRIYEPDDLLRQEIEFAIEKERIIIPIFVDDFEFSSVEKKLNSGTIARLPSYQAARLRVELFDKYLDLLCNRYLVLPVNLPKITPVSQEVAEISQKFIMNLDNTASPAKSVLSSEKELRKTLDYNEALEEYEKLSNSQKLISSLRWILLDFCVVMVSCFISTLLRTSFTPISSENGILIFLAPIISVIMLYLHKVYNLSWQNLSGVNVSILNRSIFWATLLLTILNLLVVPRPFLISVLWLSMILSFGGILVARFRYRLVEAIIWRWQVIWSS